MIRLLFLIYASFLLVLDAQAQRLASQTPSQPVVFTGADSCFSADSTRCKMAITFRCDVSWQVYDMYGNVVLQGFGRKADIGKLSKGGYFMVSGKRSFEFFKE